MYEISVFLRNASQQEKHDLSKIIWKNHSSPSTTYFIRPLFQHAIVSGPWEITASLAAVTAEITTWSNWATTRYINTLGPEQNCWHSVDSIWKCILLNEKLAVKTQRVLSWNWKIVFLLEALGTYFVSYCLFTLAEIHCIIFSRALCTWCCLRYKARCLQV